MNFEHKSRKEDRREQKRINEEIDKLERKERKAKLQGKVKRLASNGFRFGVLCLVFASITATGRADTVERVIDALVQIESSGRPSAIGDGGKAVGLLQLHPVAVLEANRIAGNNRWKLSDRLCPVKSRAMARTILMWHYRRGVTDPVDLACKWNRPFGDVPKAYRAKAMAAFQI